MTFSRNLYKVKKKYHSTLRMMEPVVLSERVNLEAVKYLITKPKAWWKEILKTDKKRKFDGLPRMLRLCRRSKQGKAPRKQKA